MNRVSPETLHGWLLDEDAELALLDVREAGEFGLEHLLFAVPVPYSQLESKLERLVPHRTTRLVLGDDGSSGVAERAARRATALGYAQVHVLDGGTRGWKRAGYRLFAGVNVPSKAFGELVEEVRHTPRVTAQELHDMLTRGERVLVVDGRPVSEYRTMNIPGSICCPNGELAYRISALVADSTIPVVVNCAGRTRSIIGAQTLIDAGVRNPVFALEDGTQGWVLAGFELERGSTRRYPASPSGDLEESSRSAAALAARHGVRSVDAEEARQWLSDRHRTTYLLDVRTPEEFETGAIAGAWHAPGGQLLQASDQWLAVRGARVLLVDYDGVRAPIVAQWLRRMGWNAHTVRFDAGADISAGVGPGQRPRFKPPLPDPVSRAVLRDWVCRGDCVVVDLRPSMEFRRGHVPGSRWSIRPRIAQDVPADASRVVLVSDDAHAIGIAALELADRSDLSIHYLEDGYRGWVDAGEETVASPDVPSDQEAIDYLFFVHDRHDGNLDAARRYLSWEKGLTRQLEPAERARFDP